jgi:radical SAM superfamily enzyme YgiQ (UPF0313 family)
MKVSLFDVGKGIRSFGTFSKSYWTSIPHYGLCTLSAVAKKAGHRVDLIDIRQVHSFIELEEKIHKQTPDVIGLSMRTCDELLLKDMAERIKKINSKITIIVGGVHVSIAWRRLKEVSQYDYLVTGEGEITFPKLLNYLEGNSSKDNFYLLAPKVIRGEPIDMDLSPPIDRELYPYEECIKFQNYPGIFEAPMITMLTSRGCPYHCKFCAPSKISSDEAFRGRKLKYASVDRVVDELILIRQKYPFKSIKFYDYSFTVNKMWVEEFCEKYKANGFDQKFIIQTRADLVRKNPDIIEALAKIGLKAIIVGYESGSDKVLQSLGKQTSAEDNLEAAKIIKKNNIVNIANYMLGTPFEEKEDVNLTVAQVREIKPDIVSVSFFTPIEGTELYDYTIENDLSLVQSANDLWTYSPEFERIKGIDYKYLTKAAQKILANNSPIPLFGYLSFLIYTKTKKYVAVRETLVYLYSKYISLKKQFIKWLQALEG